MNNEIFLMELLIVSVLVSLATEAVKTILKDYERTYHANALAGIIAVVISVAVSVMYAVVAEEAWTDKMTVYLIALVFLSWLSAMVGYDKVIQAIAQFKTAKD